MNYGEIVNRIKYLGFADDTDMEEYVDAIPDKINLAIEEITNTIAPVIATYEFSQDGTDDELLYYDMDEISGGTFLDFDKVPVLWGDKVYTRFNDYEIENNQLIIDGNIKGNFRVFYQKEHPKYTVETLETEACEVPLKAQYLIPLLASYYIWLDDDSVKAAYYYNEYEKESSKVLSKIERPRGRILSGGI